MSLHQIIYTSCKRGRDGVNDGQQVYSYDRTFKESIQQDITPLFSYRPPALRPNVTMTEEIALSMPDSFTFRGLGDGKYAFALSTYLGRDYMGTAGRFGNHLSHVVILDESDIDGYPCEYYGSSMLRSRMDFEEVNNPNVPDYLPDPMLEKGPVVDVDAIMEFLSEDNRLEIYKSMLCAMLSFESDKKRVVICDDHENIVKWIAALQYAIPFQAAWNINFCTYDYNPELSRSRICGVLPEGTPYNETSFQKHFTYDFENGRFAEMDTSDEFYDFVDTAMGLSYSALEDFHQFLAEGYNYTAADKQIYAAYYLYTVLVDGVMDFPSEEKLDSALEFAKQYATYGEKRRIVSFFLENREKLIRLDRVYFLKLLHFICANSDDDEAMAQIIKGLLVDRTLVELLDENAEEKEFTGFVSEIETLSTSYGFKVFTEILSEKNRDKLFAVMRKRLDAWKYIFIIHMLSCEVKDRGLPAKCLQPDASTGQIYNYILREVYADDTSKALLLISKLMDEFCGDIDYLISIAFSLEKMLKSFGNSTDIIKQMWKYFGQQLMTRQRENIDRVYKAFRAVQRNELLFWLFGLELRDAATDQEKKQVFSSHAELYLIKNDSYTAAYRQRVLQCYYDAIKNSANHEETRNYLIWFFGYLYRYKWNAELAEELINNVLRGVPYQELSSENKAFIQNAYIYCQDFGKPIAGRFLLLLTAMLLSSAYSGSQMKDHLERLKELTEKTPAKLSSLSEANTESYFNWILPRVCENCRTFDELTSVYHLFDMNSMQTTMFLVNCGKYYVKLGKADQNFEIMSEYLGVVFTYSDAGCREEVGKVLHKLSKQRRADLDGVVKEAFSTDREALKLWDEIKIASEASNSILSGISGVIRKKKESAD